jgi:hypothetical protein
MKVDQYKVTLTFDLAILSGQERSERVVLELNGIFHDVIKTWVRDRQAIASPPSTTIEGIENK